MDNRNIGLPKRFIFWKTGASAIIILSFLFSGCKPPPKLEDLYWPSPPDPPRIKFVKSIYSSREVKRDTFFTKLKAAIAGAQSTQGMAKPFGVFAKKDRLYVADTVQRAVLVFDYKKFDFKMLGRGGKGQLLKPLDVFVDDSGRIYVCDGSAAKVVVYNKNYRFIRAIGKKGEIDRPGGIVVNEKLDEGRGRVYISDILKHNVHVYDLKGNKLFDFGQRGIEEGEFNYPTNMAIDKKGNIYVVDSMNFRIQIFDPDGKPRQKFGDVGDQFGNFARPKGIAIDEEGHVYVSDAAFNNIQIFDSNGRLLLFFANMGYKRGELWMPSGMAIDEKNQIYVADQYNHRINVYQYLTEDEGMEILKKDEEMDDLSKENT